MIEPERPSARKWWERRIATYEDRYLTWCLLEGRDPEDGESVLAYEQQFGEEDLPTHYDYDP